MTTSPKPPRPPLFPYPPHPPKGADVVPMFWKDNPASYEVPRRLELAKGLFLEIRELEVRPVTFLNDSQGYVGYQHLECPICKGPNLHQYDTVEGSPRDANHGVETAFWCEGCTYGPLVGPKLGKHAVLQLYQHKGFTIVQWSIREGRLIVPQPNGDEAVLTVDIKQHVPTVT